MTALKAFRNREWIERILLSFLICWFCGCSDGGRSNESLPETPLKGQAILGPLVNADVSIYRYTDLSTAIYTTKTTDSQLIDEAGTFDVPSDLFENDGLYIFKITGGMDIDKNDDGLLDESATVNQGLVHLCAPGSYLNESNIKANILTEILYQSYYYMIHSGYSEQDISDHLVQSTDYLLREDFNGDGRIDFKDVFEWSPVTDRDSLSRPWHYFESYTNAILSNTSRYDALEKITSPVIGYLLACSDVDEDPCLNAYTAVAVDNNYAYTIGGYSDFNVIDITTPESPVKIGHVTSASWPLDLALSGPHVLVADALGLFVYNVEIPENPALESTIPQIELTGIAISGTTAYASEFQGGLYIFNIADLANPTIISHLDTPGQGNDIALSDAHAYIAGGQVGLQIIDVSNPELPYLTNSVETTGTADSVTVHEDVAYVAMGDAGVEIIDLNDITSPEIIAHIETSGYTSHIAVDGHLAYIDGEGVAVYDITNPAAPVLTKRYMTPGSPSHTAINDDRMVSVDVNGLAVMDKYVPSLFNYIVGSCAESVNPQTVYVHENFLFVFKGIFSPSTINRMLQVYNLTNPEKPELIEEYEIPGSTGGGTVAFYGGYAYVTDHGYQITVLDLNGQDAPVVVGTYDTEASSITDIIVSDGYAYLSCATPGLMVMNIANPEMPVQVGSLELEDWHSKMCIKDHYIYLSSNPNGLFVIDIKDPTSPVLVQEIELPANPHDIALNDDYIVIATEQAGLMFYDASEPDSPSYVSTFSNILSARALTISGGYAYVADGTAGVVVLDIRDPLNPIKICRMDIVYADDISISGGHAYVATGGWGVKVVKVIN